MAKQDHLPWQAIAQEARDYRDATLATIQPPIPDISGQTPKNVFETLRSNLSVQEIEITELSPEKLLEHLRTGTLSAVAVTNAFLRRAGLAQKLVGLLSICSVL